MRLIGTQCNLAKRSTQDVHCLVEAHDTNDQFIKEIVIKEV